MTPSLVPVEGVEPGLGASLGAALSIPIQRISGWDWRQVLAVWAIPAFAAALLLIRQASLPHHPGDTADSRALPHSGLDIYRDRLAWSVTLVFGMQSLIFFAVIAWMPAILVDAGVDAGTAGLQLAIFNLIGLPLTFLVPIMAAQRSSQFALMTVGTLLNAIGLLGLALAPATWTMLWVVSLGLGQASAFGLAFVLIGIRSPDDRYATELSGMAQTVGYCMAAVGPVLIGSIFELTGEWNFAFGLLIAAVAILQISGAKASRPRPASLS